VRRPGGGQSRDGCQGEGIAELLAGVDRPDARPVGGHLAIDFVNTLGGRPEDPDDEYLNGYNDLLAWTERTGLLQPYALADLRNAATAKPESAEAALERARLLREALDRLLEPTSTQNRNRGRATRPPSVLPTSKRSPMPPLKRHNLHLAWAWPDGTNDLNRPLWPIALAAVDLFKRRHCSYWPSASTAAGSSSTPAVSTTVGGAA
jgi:Putative stress-induced transcription regulator